MYPDHSKKAEHIRRRMVRNTRIAGFIGASLAHFAASALLLGLQTSCAVPPCVGGIRFEMFRAVMHVPLFITPWLGLPSPDHYYERDPMLGAWLLLNALLAVALYWAVGIAAHRGYRHWKARRWEKCLAAQRARSSGP
ncbi:MAG TPA: hypothetical protein VM621_02155 [Luteibacter sp.]|uniref:hypothetical protein n=1 Tax=Luteibacter sp. TaxID=1886636 RepID=UPI002C77691D|nr:hypothetical protein [Luteibacter sp.]HVI53839.1 hypothetical protein [Luteibacter sp.]